MKKLRAAFWTVGTALAMVAGATYLQGRMTDRWSGRNVTAELKQAAMLLESRFPERFAGWETVEEIAASPRELEKAGAVGHISRVYRNDRGKAALSTFVVCATPRDASGHTPDRCYPGAGFEIAETEHRETVPLTDGREARVFTGTFRRAGQTLRVFWTYGVGGEWVAPQIARIELADAKAVYKLYAIIDETPLPPGVGSRVCRKFLAELLPSFDAALRDQASAPASL